jgi:hypothetical protein
MYCVSIFSVVFNSIRCGIIRSSFMQCYFSNSSVRNCLAEYILIRLKYNGSQSSYKGNLFKLHICFIEEEKKKRLIFQ